MPQNNQTYWNSRKQQFSASLAKDETRLFAKLATYYEREAAALEKQIAAYYTQYGEGNVIAYRQLLQSLNDADVQLLMQDMEAFAEKYPEYADLLPVRESIYKLNRLEGLQTSILLQQLEIGAVEQEQLTAFFLKQAARYANFSAEWLGFGEQFYRIDSDMVKKAVGNSWCEGKNFSERIWNNRQKLAHTLQTEVVNGIIRGEDYHTLARNLRQKFTNISRKQAERLVYTEDTYLSCEAAITPFANDPSFTQYRFACTHDGNACDICKALDGEAFPIKERTPGTNFPPMHPWCRCFFEIVVPEKNALTSDGDGGIIKTELKRSKSRKREDIKPISKKRFDQLTIEVRKKGAIIFRGGEEVESHLDFVGADASILGDIIFFRSETCISEVLEETHHFIQNVSKMNDDKGEPLRTYLNEIDAKKYLLENAKKYKIPRSETQLTEEQLEYYQKLLKEYMEKNYE